jgi:NIPSNAP
MYCELITLTPRAGMLHEGIRRLESLVAGPELLGCFHTILGNHPRIFVLRRSPAQTEHEVLRAQSVQNTGVMALADLMKSVSFDIYHTLPCLPGIPTGRFGSLYEFRIYELQPMAALEAAHKGWADVIQVRLDLAPITAVMHSVTGQIPRLVHIYPYRDMQERLDIRERAIATGLWPPKGGSSRNQVMAAEMTVPAPYSPLN